MHNPATLPRLRHLAHFRLGRTDLQEGEYLLRVPTGDEGATAVAKVAGPVDIRALQDEGEALPEASGQDIKGTLVDRGVVLAVRGENGKGDQVSALVTDGPTVVLPGVCIITLDPAAGCSADWACLVLRASSIAPGGGRVGSDGLEARLRDVPIEVPDAEEQARRCTKAARLHALATELACLSRKQARLMDELRGAVTRNIVRHGEARPRRADGEADSAEGGQPEAVVATPSDKRRRP